MNGKARFAAALVLGAALTAAGGAHSHDGLSDASALSLLPVAVSVGAPSAALSAGAALTVVSVEVTALGTVWVLQRASDGARMSVRLSADVAGGLSVAVGTAVTVSVVGAGWMLSVAGEAVALVPNEIGRALLYSEPVTR